MFEGGQSREVTAAQRRRREHVAVEIELQTVGGDAVRHGGQTSPRTVHNTTRRVTEASRRTRRRRRRMTAVTGRRFRQRRQSTDQRLNHCLDPQTSDNCRRQNRHRSSSRSSSRIADAGRRVIDHVVGTDRRRHGTTSGTTVRWTAPYSTGHCSLQPPIIGCILSMPTLVVRHDS